MPFRFESIKPKRPLQDVGKLVRNLTSGMKSLTIAGQRFMQDYPPQTLTKSGYKRTRTLGRSWSQEMTVSGDTITGIVGSSRSIAPYNKYVQGRRGKEQARLFAGTGWHTVDQLEAELRKELPRMIKRAVKESV